MDGLPVPMIDFKSYMLTIKGASSNTVREYMYDLRLFFRFLKKHRKIVDKSMELNNISIDDIDIDFIRAITLSELYAFFDFVAVGRKNKQSARARKIACLKSFFKYYTVKRKLLDKNPAEELDTPKQPIRLPKHLEIDESKHLLESVDGTNEERDYCILTLFLNCGLRLQELVDIDVSKIRNEYMTVVGKGNKERGIPLNKACIDSINNYLSVRPKVDTDALFISRLGKRVSRKAVQNIVKKRLKEAGLEKKEYSTHKLRHTAATLMHQYGHVDIRVLQELLGHESIATTKIYTHINSSELKVAVDNNPLAEVHK